MYFSLHNKQGKSFLEKKRHVFSRILRCMKFKRCKIAKPAKLDKKKNSGTAWFYTTSGPRQVQLNAKHPQQCHSNKVYHTQICSWWQQNSIPSSSKWMKLHCSSILLAETNLTVDNFSHYFENGKKWWIPSEIYFSNLTMKFYKHVSQKKIFGGKSK